MARRITGVVASLEGLAKTRKGAAVLFVLALVVFVVEAQAWPLRGGRDIDEYLRYYVLMRDWSTLLPTAMLTHTPLTPVVTGLSLDVAHGALVEPLAAVLFAASIVTWSAVGLAFGPRVGLLTAVALLAYPGYAAMFHEVASEMVFAPAFAVWALLVTRAVERPSVTRFAFVGGGIAVLVLIRPGNQVLIAAAILPLFLSGAWRMRLASSAALVLAAVLPLAAWAVVNGLRYGEYAVASGGEGALFHHAFVVDRTVTPANGPASRKLAQAIRTHLLTRDPYRSYGVTLDQIFASGSFRVSEDIGLLSDQVFGWNSSILRDAGLEAIRANPRTYASDVLRTIWIELSEPYYPLQSHGREAAADGTQTSVVRGRRLPSPEGQLIPAGQSGWISRPDNAIRIVWTSPTQWNYVFTRPADKVRFTRIERRLDELFGRLPHRGSSESLSLRLNQLSRWFPRPVLWLVVGAVALVLRRPRGSRLLIALAGSAILVISATAAVAPTDLHYSLPVAPAFIVFCIGALLARRTKRWPCSRPADEASFRFKP